MQVVKSADGKRAAHKQVYEKELRQINFIKMYKYKINEYLYGLNVVEYSAARKIIPQELEISLNTFHNYRNIRIDSEADIPYCMIRKLEILFKMSRGGLENFKMKGEDLQSLIYKRKNKK